MLYGFRRYKRIYTFAFMSSFAVFMLSITIAFHSTPIMNSFYWCHRSRASLGHTPISQSLIYEVAIFKRTQSTLHQLKSRLLGLNPPLDSQKRIF